MKEAKIRKTTDFMVGGCNVCPTVKTDIYVLDLNGRECPLEELSLASLITAIALSNGYKQYQEYDSFEDYDVFKKENNQVELIPEFNKLWIGYTRLDKKNKVCTIIKNTLEENHVKTSKKNLFNRI